MRTSPFAKKKKKKKKKKNVKKKNVKKKNVKKKREKKNESARRRFNPEEKETASLKFLTGRDHRGISRRFNMFSLLQARQKSRI